MSERQTAVSLVNEACKAGARKEKACELLSITPRTIQRWEKGSSVIEDQRKYRQQTPGNKLSPEERDAVLVACNLHEYRSLPPSQIVPSLADKGIYIASESSFYRILRAEGQLKHRGKAKPRTVEKPEPYVARGPNEVWTWDITYLPTVIKGSFYYLYMIMDIFSRKIVGWEVHEKQTDELASVLARRAYISEGIAGRDLVLHSDNGSPMKGATMLATLQKLSVAASFSRPSVSNDNPYSEALFKTLKYKPGYPAKPFESLEESRDWVLKFVRWYNEKHKHSNLKFVSPALRHEGKDSEILKRRKEVYEEARNNNPARWSGKTRNWDAPEEVHLNPGRKTEQEINSNKAA
ncbi:MAG: IS3 family transposase [Planctomycetes bacterium]|nr:IS3 family transposase [Planctomycetota bacterium]